MTLNQIILLLIVYIIIPLLGFCYFLNIKNQMKIEKIKNPPIVELFLIFTIYGGLLLITLTSIISTLNWSGMASLGTFSLIIFAPFVMAIIAYHNRIKINISKYHKWTYKLGLLYFVITPIIFGILFCINKN